MCFINCPQDGTNTTIVLYNTHRAKNNSCQRYICIFPGLVTPARYYRLCWLLWFSVPSLQWPKLNNQFTGDLLIHILFFFLRYNHWLLVVYWFIWFLFGQTSPSSLQWTTQLSQLVSKLHVLISAGLVKKSKVTFNNTLSRSPRQLFSTFNALLHLPSPPPTNLLNAQEIANHFKNEIETIRLEISSTLQISPALYTLCPSVQSKLLFNPTTTEEVKLSSNAHLTSCLLDPVPSQILQSLSDSILHSLTHIFNLSLSTGTSPTLWNMH